MLLGVLREGILEIVEDGGYASESELVQVAVYRFELGNIDAGNIAGRELPNVSYEELAELLGVTPRIGRWRGRRGHVADGLAVPRSSADGGEYSGCLTAGGTMVVGRR